MWQRSKWWIVASVEILSVFSVGALAWAAEAPPNKYRKITNGVGNCIFSTKLMEPRKEESYTDVRTAFKAGEPLHTRCYFAHAKKGFEPKGKLYNSLRDDKAIYTELTVREAATRGKKKDFPHMSKESDKTREFDSVRYVLDPSDATCAWKGTSLDEAPNACLDIGKVMKQVADSNQATQGELCLTAFIRYADDTKRVWDADLKAWVDRPVVAPWSLATGCITYTVGK